MNKDRASRFRRQLGIVDQQRVENLRIHLSGGGPVLPFLLQNLALLGCGRSVGELRFDPSLVIEPRDVDGQCLWDDSMVGEQAWIAAAFCLEALVGSGAIQVTSGDASGCDVAIELDPASGRPSCNGIPVIRAGLTPVGWYVGSGGWPVLQVHREYHLGTAALASACAAQVAQEVLRVTGAILPVLIGRVGLTLEMELPDLQDDSAARFILDGLGPEQGLRYDLVSRTEGGFVARLFVPPSVSATWDLFDRVTIRTGVAAGWGRAPIPMTWFSPFVGVDATSSVPEAWRLDACSRWGGRSILVGGLGGLGTWIAAILARSPLGDTRLVLSDFDRVEEHNLNRQVLYRGQDVGLTKAEAALASVNRLRPGIRATPWTERIDFDSLDKHLEEVDGLGLVISAFDNAFARYVLGMTSYQRGIPFCDSGGGVLDGNVNFYQPKMDCILCHWTAGLQDDPARAWELAQAGRNVESAAARREGCQADDKVSSNLAGAIATTSALIGSLAAAVGLAALAEMPQPSHQLAYFGRSNRLTSCVAQRSAPDVPCSYHRHGRHHAELEKRFLADRKGSTSEAGDD